MRILLPGFLSLMVCCGQQLALGAEETGVERLDPRLDAIVAPDAEVEVLATGYSWAEGPVWDAAQQRLLFSDVPNNRVHVWTEDEGAAVWLEPSGHTGFGAPPNPKRDGANGLALDEAGRLLLCQHGDRRVARLEQDGSFTTLASEHDGKRFNSPNDLALGSDGSIYFTDPAYGLHGDLESEQRELPYTGVYRITPEGAVELLVEDLFPNGIALTADASRCYVTDGSRLWVYPLTADGGFGAGRVFFTLPEHEEGGFDGLVVDAAGTVFLSNWQGGVLVLNPEGDHLGTLHSGSHNANCCLGGTDGRTLFITAGSRLVRIALQP